VILLRSTKRGLYTSWGHDWSRLGDVEEVVRLGLGPDPPWSIFIFLADLRRTTKNDEQKARQKTISARLWLAKGAFALAQPRSDIPP